jgi:hypothetical protein
VRTIRILKTCSWKEFKFQPGETHLEKDLLEKGVHPDVIAHLTDPKVGAAEILPEGI